MITILTLTAFLSLVYPTFSLINQHLHAATPLYSPWQWALALAWPALGNRLALKQPRSVLWLFVFNLAIFLPAGGVFLFARFPSHPWLAVLPVLLELALVWIPVASLATQRLVEDEIRRLWESGLVVAALVALAREMSHTLIPLFQSALLTYLAAGVALRVFAALADANTTDASARRTGPPLAVSLGVLVFGAFFGMFVAGRRIAGMLLAALQGSWNFLLLLLHYLAMIIEKLGLNRAPGQPAQRPKIPGATMPADLGPGLQSAPLWFMIPLWIIMAVVVAISLWMLIRMLYENIVAMRREMAERIIPARRRLRRPDLRVLLTALIGFMRFLLNRLKRWLSRRYPRDLAILYDAFILWGRRNRRPRRRSETPTAYLKRLEPEVTANCPELLPAIQNLTRRYEQFCYAQNIGAELIDEEPTLVHKLRQSRLQKKKFFGIIPVH